MKKMKIEGAKDKVFKPQGYMVFNPLKYCETYMLEKK
jgi:hypothetical protein